MLVLSRRTNEEVEIGDDITVVVLSIQGDRVRLGFNAPREVPIHRKEVADSIRRHGRRQLASRPAGGDRASG